MGEVLAVRNAAAASAMPVPAEALAELIGLVREGTLSTGAAKSVFGVLAREGGSARAIADREGLLQVGDDGALRAWVDEVFAENPAEAVRFAAGERKLQGVLVGLVMKKSKGSADPRKVSQLIGERAGK